MPKVIGGTDQQAEVIGVGCPSSFGPSENDSICIVRSKEQASCSEPAPPPNVQQYGIFQRAYDFFNEALFGASLPQLLVTLQRDHRSFGYFSKNSFQQRLGRSARIHEICLNPDGFVGRADRDILGTFVHEMVHVHQLEHGHPGRGGYHNREFARLMHSIGLMPSATGQPGGATTGEHMSHYILEGGRFTMACEAFLARFELAWESAVEEAANSAAPPPGAGSPPSGRPTPRRRSSINSKTKLSCPNGHVNAWARPGAKLICGECYEETHEAVPLLPVGRAQGGQKRRSI
jgi:hypothetical protein